MGVTTRRNTSENHNKKRRNHNKQFRKQDSKLRNQNGETFKMPKSVPARAPPRPEPWTEKPARAWKSTIFETFTAQNAEICTPLRPCPPAPWTPRGQSTGEGSPKCRNLYSPAPVPPRQICSPTTGAGEYDFRDFQGSKCRNLYSPAPVPPSSLDPREAMRLPHNIFDVLADAC